MLQVKSNSLVVGDVVYENGGPLMTVSGHHGRSVICRWHTDAGVLKTVGYDRDSLHLHSSTAQSVSG